MVYSISELDLKSVKTTLEGANGMNDDVKRYIDATPKHLRQGSGRRNESRQNAARGLALIALAAVSACATKVERLDESQRWT